MENKRNGIHKLFFINIAYVGSAYHYFTLLRIEKSCGKAGEGGFAATRRTHKSYGFTGAYFKRNIRECVFFAVVAVCDIFKLYGIVLGM